LSSKIRKPFDNCIHNRLSNVKIAKVLSVQYTQNSLRAGETSAMSLKATIEKIRNLEAEKRTLLIEIEDLKKMADCKAATLESEVSALRDEVNSLKILVSSPEQPSAPNF